VAGASGTDAGTAKADTAEPPQIDGITPNGGKSGLAVIDCLSYF